MRRYIVPYVIALLLVDPFAISQSMQFVSVYYIYNIASIVYILKRGWFDANRQRLLFYFVIIGAATSYFDFLTYPLVTFGIPAIFFLCYEEETQSVKTIGRTLAGSLISWGVGYVGMWSGKWVLGSFLGNENIIAIAWNKILERSSLVVSSSGEEFSIIYMLRCQLTHLKSPAMLLAILLLAGFVILILFSGEKKKIFDYRWILFLCLCLLPFAWYIIASNHSYIHNWFTYRELIITAFSGMCMFARYARISKIPKIFTTRGRN